jgi:hypothetical protein
MLHLRLRPSVLLTAFVATLLALATLTLRRIVDNISSGVILMLLTILTSPIAAGAHRADTHRQ